MESCEIFSAKQQDTFTRVSNLEEILDQSIDPTTFVLSPIVQNVQNQIFELQQNCDHIWEDGKCIVCGKVKE